MRISTHVILNRSLRDMMKIKQTEDFLYPENLDSYHKGIMEKENAQKEMNSFMAHNPGRFILKLQTT